MMDLIGECVLGWIFGNGRGFLVDFQVDSDSFTIYWYITGSFPV